MCWDSIASFAGPIIGGALGANAAGNAADVQSAAGRNAANMANAQYQQTRSDLFPYVTTGYTGTTMLGNRLGDLTTPMTMTQTQLEATPGYQFTRDQGLKSVQNSYAARGLGSSGAALKGAADYTTGLANKTWQDQFNAAQLDRNNIYNKLLGTAQLGANSAAQVGQLGNSATQTATNALTSGAAAQGAGDVGFANAISGGINSGYNNYNNNNLLQMLMRQQNANGYGPVGSTTANNWTVTNTGTYV